LPSRRNIFAEAGTSPAQFAALRGRHFTVSPTGPRDASLSRRSISSKPAQIAVLRRRLAEKRFDLLFVNAGIMNDDTIAEVSTADFTRVMVTNALGPMRVVEAFEDLVKRGGTIGVMSSGLGSISRSDGYLPVYSASKAALNMLMKGFAARHAARATVIIAPGWVRTDLGGRNAPLSIAQSIPRVVDVITSRTGKRGLLFLNYRGKPVPW
jgi:NAD(P)-dependent dehydrogenase (short-subunit alcohol dehydrogenase family)